MNDRGGLGARNRIVHLPIPAPFIVDPIIEGYDPPEGWGWCYVDEVFFDLSDRRTPQRGPIPHFY